MPPRRKAARPAPKPGSAEAKEQALFDALADLLRRLGHDVHVSKTLDGRGGDCLVNGSPRVIVSRRLPMAERVDVLVEIARRQDLSAAELSPELAEVLHAPAASEPVPAATSRRPTASGEDAPSGEDATSDDAAPAPSVPEAAARRRGRGAR